MKRLAALAALALLLPTVALAHEYRSAGSVQVLLHIDPNDDPATNEPSTLKFFVSDADNNFTGAQCDCRATITVNNKTMLSQAVTVQDNGTVHEGQLPFSFPSLGVYTIIFKASPKPGGQFQPFSLQFGQRVSSVGYQQRGSSDLIYIGVAAVIAAALGWTLWRFRPKSPVS